MTELYFHNYKFNAFRFSVEKLTGTFYTIFLRKILALRSSTKGLATFQRLCKFLFKITEF